MAGTNSRPYFQLAIGYMEDVASGKRPANKFERLAVERQIADLQAENFNYTFSVEKAERACKFIERMPHIKGKWGGKKLQLEPWQIFIITTIFGWIDAQGRRRFKTVYLEIPRKNAKSTLTSAVGLYLCFADGEPGAEVYSAATTRDQAKVVWADAKKMAEKTQGLRRRFGVKTSAHSIYSDQSDSKFLALSRDTGGNLDGLNVHGGLIDELHGHRSRDVFDVIETGTGAREQPLLWLITTAGSNTAGICYEQRTYVVKILTGNQLDESYFGIIYTIDDDDDWLDEAAWQKANPNFGVSVNIDDLRRKALKARSLPSAQNNFKTKHLNVWVNSDSPWMDMMRWNSKGDLSLRIEDFYGMECYIGLDLASKIDVVSKVYVFVVDDKFVTFSKHYLPENAVEESKNSQYQGWEEQGVLQVTAGAMTDYKLIEDDLVEDNTNFSVVEVGYDKWQANYMSSNLIARGLNMIEVPQTVKNLSAAMKEVEARVINKTGKTLVHDANPVMDWMISNVVCHTDARDNVFPRKEKPENKIDGAMALLIAVSRANTAGNTGDLFDEF